MHMRVDNLIIWAHVVSARTHQLDVMHSAADYWACSSCSRPS